ncbi:MAG: outer membrane beta-barrel protein [Vitreimonas sp.]
MAGHWRWLSATAAVALAAAPTAKAQQTGSVNPATPAHAASQDDDEIVVRADADQVRIDRRVYALRNDPIAQSTDMFDVLGRIPSVSVAPTGTVTLLGAGNPTIQINGQPLPPGANLEQVLRGLTGADVERIEVITNPSAQYSAATSGGIINIVTHQRFNSGFTGNASVMADTYGATRLNLAPNWSEGPWSFGGRLSYYDYQTHFRTERAHNDLSSGIITTDLGHQSVENVSNGVTLQTTYQPNHADKASLSLDYYSSDSARPGSINRTSAGVPLFQQDQNQTGSNQFGRLNLLIQHDGHTPREQVRFNAALTHFGGSDDTILALTPASGPAPSPFLTGNDQSDDEANITLDYDHPLSGDQFLTAGISLDAERLEINDEQRTLVGPPGAGDFRSTLNGNAQTLALYSTYQVGAFDWVFLPGLRAEYYRRDVSSLGAGTDHGDLRVFPTLHIRRSFSAIDLDLSYTSRIRRPDLSDLDPAVHFEDATHASGGNPDLQPSTVDAYEANFTHQTHSAMFGLTFYDRINRDVFSPFVSQVGGVTLSTTVNGGEQEQRGLQAVMRGPLGRHWVYSVTANALNSAFDTLHNGIIARDSAVEYNGNASLEYRDINQREIGADDVQFEVRFQSAQHSLQQASGQFYYTNLNWRRRLSDRLFAFLQVYHVFGTLRNESLTRGDDFIERSITQNPGIRFRLSLTYQFGAPSDRPPPEPSDSSGGPQH